VNGAGRDRPSTRRLPVRRWLLGGLAVALAGTIGGVLLRAEPGRGATAAPTSPPAPAPATAAAYRVVYRVVDTLGSRPMVSTDVLQVRRPDAARLEHRDGPPPGGEVSSSTVVNRRFVFSSARTARTFATRRIPGPLPQADSVEALEAAVNSEQAARLGERSVAGERCTRYAYRRGGDEILVPPQPGEQVETCVTGDGIRLREATTMAGRELRVAEAVDVKRAPAVTAAMFLDGSEPAALGAALVETDQLVTEEDVPGASRLVTVAGPVGFRAARTVLVERQAGETAAPESLSVRSFDDGTDVVAVEQLVTPSSGPPWPVGEGRPVDLGGGRSGRIVYRPSGAEVRVAIGGRFVRVRSSRPSTALATARTLRG
jgi:hypothetical protein